LLSKKEKRCCIFCLNHAPDVSFKKIAHAISETVGNKILISHFECDDCNKLFGDFLEDSLGKYMLPFKIITQVYGKKNKLVAKDKTEDSSLTYGSYRIQFNKDEPILPNFSNTRGILITRSSNPSNIIKMNEAKNEFEINIPRQKYDPRLVYCSFLKMAYSILPLYELKNYLNRINELHRLISKETSDTDKENLLNNFPNKGVLIKLFDKSDQINVVSAILYKRTSSVCDNHPLFVFRLDMGIFSFIIPVPCDNDGSGDIQLKVRGEFAILDFTKSKEVETITFSADCQKIPEDKISEIATELRKKHLLRSHNVE